MANKPILQDSITGVWSYILSIDWEEPWLYILISFHIWCALATLVALLHKLYYPQIGLFIFYLGLAFCSEYINTWAAQNYKLFSEQQYFDSQGMFISLLFSFPLLCNTLVIVVYWMWDLTQSMITLKRTKVQQSRKAMEKVAQVTAEAKSEDNPSETNKSENTDDGENNTSDSGDGQKDEQIEEKTAADKKDD